ncbi:F0F1 ATP synthase subunit epsilon [bacterium]|jgi:F-type H+-transporting ATPase subunit epsilon|nr:F0F1 ATP synthase subunit epsilon [bacterium]MBT3850149.1 F0F1 ATP synthase subunit epsilon [bacterium]MBT4634618.1 F0F1 ATP synthase subunit epsilon [bacterium]
MNDFFNLTIYSPEEVIFNDKAVGLSATNSVGEFGILPGHTLFSSNILPCNLSFTSFEGDSRNLTTGPGLITVKSNEVIVVLESAKAI